MAKPVQTMYFALKVVAPRLGDKRMLADSTLTTSATMGVTTHMLETAVAATNAGDRHVRIGHPASTTVPGVAGHFTASILDFSDAEDRKCKTLGEAEQLMKKKHADWLADAYDWFVFPANIHAGDATAGKPAKKAKTK